MGWKRLVCVGCALVLIVGSAQGFEATVLERDSPSLMDRFGQPMDVDGEWAVIGTGGDEVIFFHHDGSGWVQHQVIENDDDINFGDVVAIGGDYTFIGADNHDLVGASNAGGVYVYRFDGSTWVEEQILTANDPQVNGHFGERLAVDGDNLVVGVPSHDHGGLDDCGAAYVFNNDGGTWTQVTQLTASDYSDHATFGCAVDISGEMVMVGAREADPVATSSGAVYVYTWNGSDWVEQLLTASDGSGQDYFGSSVAMDGDHAFVGAHGCDEGWDEAGAAYVFANEGGTWVQQEKLIGPEPFNTWIGSGYSNLMVMEGDWALIWAEYGDEQYGSVFVYHYDGSAWNELYEMTSWTGGTMHNFGGAIALEGDVAFIGDNVECMHVNYAGCVWVCTDLMNPVGVSETTAAPLPERYQLLPVYPNPFNPTTTVALMLRRAAELTVTVHNVTGRQVARLAQGWHAAGTHTLVLDGSNLASGMYMVHARIPGKLDAVRKVLLVR